MNLNLKIKVRVKKREDRKCKSFWESCMLCFSLHYALGQEKIHFLLLRIITCLLLSKKKCEDSKHKNMLKLIISVDSLSELSIL